MIDVKDALEIVLKHALQLGSVAVPLHQSIGRVLAEDLVADREFPPYHRVTMDGIAINSQRFLAGQRSFPVAGVVGAGMPEATLENPDSCLEIMTGAMLPKGTDSVIRYEDLDIVDGRATIRLEAIKPGQNVHKKGEDRLPGAVVTPAGTVMSPAEVGVAATIGKSKLLVKGLPKAIVISSGDELVEITETPAPHQIRRSNVHRIKTTLHSWQVSCDTAHLPDDPAVIKTKLEQLLESYPLVVLSGGVSKGKFDYIPQVLDQLGVQQLFHRIKQRPGKPMWFGVAPSGSVVFALPGNPVSSFMCTQLYLQPWLRVSAGLPPYRMQYAKLTGPIQFKPDLTYFAQVKLQYASNGETLATPIEGHGSGDLANLVDADAFMQLPRGKDRFEAGEAYQVFVYRS